MTKTVTATAPASDDPSGLYCTACRACGLWHCASPEHCGEMRPMTDPNAVSQSRSQAPRGGGGR